MYINAIGNLPKTVFYVDANNGNDSNDGSTAGLAMQTLSAAIAKANSQYPTTPTISARIMTFYLADGTYSQGPTFKSAISLPNINT